MKTLCLYYSRTNTTKTTMQLVAEILDADLYEYTDGKDRKGVLGYLGACAASMKKALPEVTIKGEPDFAAYDRVIVGMPVWAEGPCVVGRALLQQYGRELPKDVYYVVTHMAANDYKKKIEMLDALLGRPSCGHFSVRTKKYDYLSDAEAFAEVLRDHA